MAITALEQQKLIQLAVGMFNGAPGTLYLNELAGYVEGGSSIADIAASLSATSVFKSVYPTFSTAESLAAKFLSHVGLEGNALATNYVVGRLNSGDNFGTIIYEGLEFISGYTAGTLSGADDAALLNAKEVLANKVEVASYYTVDLELSDPDLDDLQAVIAGVDETQASVDAAKAAIDASLVEDTYEVSASATNVDEGATVIFNVATSGLAAGTVLGYEITGIDAADLSSGVLTGSVTLDASGNAAVSVVVAADALTEGVETMNFALLNGRAEVDVVINDTSLTPVPVTYVAAAANVTVDEGDAGTKQAVITVTLDKPAESNVVVNYQVSGGTATPANDFVLAAGAVTFAVGQDTAQVAVTINGDEEFEDDETVLVSFSGNNVAGATSTVTITNDDPDPATVPIEAVLTTGVDNVVTGPAADIIYGNQATYNPGDKINAGGQPDGTQDTLQVEVVLGNSDINLGNATVVGVERMLLRVEGDEKPGTPTNSFNGPEVILGFTNWDASLQTVEILEGTGDVSLHDLQSVPDIIIDDMTSSVWIDVDAQIAAGANDAINLHVREIGRSAESGGTGKPFIVVDDALETLNISDMGNGTTQSNFILESDGTGAGFTQVNIDQGTTGADLTVEDVNSSGAAVSVDSTAFAGDLYLDVDGVQNVMSGVGADTIIGGADLGGGNGDSDERVASPAAFTGTIDTMDGNDQVRLGMNLTGSVATGDGADTVSLYRGNAGQGDQWGDMFLPASIQTGAQNDNVQVGDMWGGTLIDGGANNDTIGVNGANGVAAGALVFGGTGGDNITVQANVAGYVDGGDDNDNININGNSVTGEVVGGNGNDGIYALNATIGEDEPVGGDPADVSGNDGNDTIQVGRILDDGIVDAGDDDDQVWINGSIDANDDGVGEWGYPTPGQLLLGHGNDNAYVYGEVNGLIDADGGADDGDASTPGNDRVWLNYDSSNTGNEGDLNNGTVILGDGDDLLIVQNASIQPGATVSGGDGDDEVTLRSYIFSGSQFDTGVFQAAGWPDANNITSIETLNLDVDPIITNPDALSYGTFNVELDAFDGALETINLRDNDGTARAILTSIDGETLNVFSNGNYDSKFGIWGNWDARIDAMSPNEGATNELTVNLQGSNSYDFKLKDNTYFTTLNLENNETSGPRAVKLDGDDGGAGVTDGTTLNLGGSATGDLTVMNVAQDMVDGSGYAGNVYLQVLDEEVPVEGDGNNDEDKTVMLGDGDDYVDFTRDYLNVTVVGGTIVSGDYIDLGGGRNTLAVDNSLRNLTPNDQDGVGVNVRNVQILETDGDDGGVLELTLEDDLRPDTVNVRNDRNDTDERGNVDLDIDEDFDDDAGAPDHLTVDVQSSDVDIDNGASVDMTVNLWANEGYSNANPYWFADANSMYSNGGGAGGAGVMFDDTGDGVVDINVAVNLVGTTNMSNNQDTTVAGNVQLFVDDGEIDSLTFLDFGPQTGQENGQITVTWDDQWAQGGDIEVDASGVNNQDFANFVGVTKDTDGTNTGGMLFIGVAENDLDFEIDGTQNDDVIWGGQDHDEIRGNDGDDFVNADPGLGTVVLPGTQKVVTVDFDTTDDVEAGDSYTIYVGNGTFTWEATADNQTVADAVTWLEAQINGANIDGDADPDVSAVADTAAGSVTITGIDVDNNFGYALGENWFVGAEVVNRPTAIVTYANEPVDVGDNARITIDGTPYNYPVGALDTIANVDQGLVTAINGGAQMTANLGSVVLRGNTPDTAYGLEAVWAPDLVTVPAVKEKLVITYTGLDVGEQVFANFVGGVGETADTVDLLRDALNGNPIISAQWFASSAGNVLTLEAVVAGAAGPSLDFLTAGVSGGAGGWSSVTTPGADEITRTDNLDPTISASKIAFTFADPAYDAGDVVHVMVDGVHYTVTLPTFPIVGETDENHDGATVAAVVRAALNANAGFVAAGLTASDDGAGTLSITTTDGAASTFSVTIDDIEQNGTAGPSNEQVTIDFSTMNDPDGLTVTVGIVTVEIDSQGTVAATLAAAQTALNGTAGYTVTVDGTNLVFNSAASGVEPDVDGASITAAITSDGGAVTVTPTAGVAAVVETNTIDFSTMTAADGAQVVLGGVTYAVLPQGTVAATLEALRVEVAAAGTDWTPSVNGTDFILTGASDGSEPAQLFGGGAVNADAGTVTPLAVVPGDATNGEEYTISIDLQSGAISSVSLTFDTNDNNTVDVLDQTLTSTDTQGLVNLINATPGISATMGGEWTANWVSATEFIVTGPSTGVGGVNEPLLMTFTGGTGLPDITLTEPADPTANPWSQDFLVDETAVGETVRVVLSDGTEIVQAWAGSEAATAVGIITQLTPLMGAAGGSFFNGGVFGVGPSGGGAITDLATTSDTINVGLGGGLLTDVSVTINTLSHTWSGDLDIYLTGPNGEIVYLMSDVGAGANWVANTITFSDSGGAIVVGANGTYAPQNDDLGGDPVVATATTLAEAFYGINPDGDWTLSIFDDAGLDVGTYASWSMAITTGDTIRVFGPASGDPANPTVSVVDGDIYTITPVLSANVDSQPAQPETIDLDFSNLGAGEVGVVTFANGESFSGATVAAIIDAINNDTAEGGLVTGPDGYTASDLGGNVVRLTGTADASPVAIAFSSAQIIATTAVTVTEDQESWENADNSNPAVTVISGHANTDADITVDQAAVAAPVATEYGNDTVYGGVGEDTINGLEGNDSLLGEDGNDVLNGGAGSDVLRGGNHNDTLSGGTENDQLYGDAGNDVLDGGSGNDYLHGGANDDNLTGGIGNDQLVGGDGNDVLFGNGGYDQMWGGLGWVDTFRFDAGLSGGAYSDSNGSKFNVDPSSQMDRIYDWESGDQLDVNLTNAGGGAVPVSFFANVQGTTELIAALEFGGGQAGRAVFDQNESLLYVDTNGDGTITTGSDLIVWLVDQEGSTLAQGNFV